MNSSGVSMSMESMVKGKPWKKGTVIRGELSTDELYEMEKHFVLRLPTDAAEKVCQVLRENYGEKIKNYMSLKIESDMRHVTVKLDKKFYHGKLMDLPCIMETLKTMDSKNLYKVGNVSQIAICGEEEETKQEEPEPTNPKKKERMYHFPHGITPPFKNVRKRRFRKTLKKKFLDAPELDRELKRLLRADMEAVSIKWEISEEQVESVAPETTEDGAASTSTAQQTKKSVVVLASGSSTLANRGKQGDAVNKPPEFCFSRDSLSDENPKKSNSAVEVDTESGNTALTSKKPADSINKKGGTLKSKTNDDSSAQSSFLFKIPARPEVSSSAVLNDPLTNSDSQSNRKQAENDGKTSSGGVEEDKERNASPDPTLKLRLELEKEVSSISRQRFELESRLKTLDNEFLKERMQGDLDKLIEQETQKRSELELLQTM